MKNLSYLTFILSETYQNLCFYLDLYEDQLLTGSAGSVVPAIPGIC
jgi:hypothetical protein